MRIGIATGWGYCVAGVLPCAYAVADGPPSVAYPVAVAILPALALCSAAAVVVAMHLCRPRARAAVAIAVVATLPAAVAGAWTVRVACWGGVEVAHAWTGAVVSVSGVDCAIWSLACAEIALVVAATVTLSQLVVPAPTCPECGRWCRLVRGIAWRELSPAKVVRKKLARRAWGYFRKLPPGSSHSGLRFDLAGCQFCASPRVLSIYRVRRLRACDPVVRDVPLATECAQAVEQLGAAGAGDDGLALSFAGS